ncbi:MAG: hypothetical protein JO105_03235 [Hyphomicrobiales bacterium]|nr:hypothetical protein [Hyphomicrobiales bacterium]
MTFPTSATRDSSWIATSALSRIGAASVDNPASPEDVALALDRLDVVVQNLQGRGVLYLADVDDTPSALAHEIANALALSLQPDFGNNAQPGSGALPSQDVTDANIRRITADLVSYGVQRVAYF